MEDAAYVNRESIVHGVVEQDTDEHIDIDNILYVIFPKKRVTCARFFVVFYFFSVLITDLQQRKNRYTAPYATSQSHLPFCRVPHVPHLVP